MVWAPVWQKSYKRRQTLCGNVQACRRLCPGFKSKASDYREQTFAWLITLTFITLICSCKTSQGLYWNGLSLVSLLLSQWQCLPEIWTLNHFVLPNPTPQTPVQQYLPITLISKLSEDSMLKGHITQRWPWHTHLEKAPSHCPMNICVFISQIIGMCWSGTVDSSQTFILYNCSCQWTKASDGGLNACHCPDIIRIKKTINNSQQSCNWYKSDTSHHYGNLFSLKPFGLILSNYKPNLNVKLQLKTSKVVSETISFHSRIKSKTKKNYISTYIYPQLYTLGFTGLNLPIPEQHEV